jgi:hypothetical protein
MVAHEAILLTARELVVLVLVVVVLLWITRMLRGHNSRG